MQSASAGAFRFGLKVWLAKGKPVRSLRHGYTRNVCARYVRTRAPLPAFNSKTLSPKMPGVLGSVP